MKKVLATILATAMALSMSAVTFATQVGGSRMTVEGMSGLEIENGSNQSDYYIALTRESKSGEVDISGFGQLFTWGDPDEREISIIPGTINGNTVENTNQKITSLTAHVNTDNVAVSIKKNDGTLHNNGKAPVIKLKGSTKGRDFDHENDFNDIEIDLDVTIGNLLDNGKVEDKKDITLTLKADESAAYSKTQYISDGETYSVSKANGSVFYFDEAITEETRIRANEYVDVFFKGNYGTDKENMRVSTDKIDEIEKYFNDIDVDYYDFLFAPKFASSVKVAIDGDENAFVYEYDKKTGDVKMVESDYVGNAHTFETKVLGTYIVAEEEYEDGNVKGDGIISEPSDTDSDKTNPGTGASDMVGVAASMAVASLTAAGVLAMKKFSK